MSRSPARVVPNPTHHPKSFVGAYVVWGVGPRRLQPTRRPQYHSFRPSGLIRSYQLLDPLNKNIDKTQMQIATVNFLPSDSLSIRSFAKLIEIFENPKNDDISRLNFQMFDFRKSGHLNPDYLLRLITKSWWDAFSALCCQLDAKDPSLGICSIFKNSMEVVKSCSQT